MESGQESFQVTKETLLALAIEIEDRKKVIDLLSIKVENEKQYIQSIPNMYLKEYTEKLNRLQIQQEIEEDKILHDTKKVMTMKENFVNCCKSTVKDIKDLEAITNIFIWMLIFLFH
jgi:hypothetical protein